MDKNTIIGFVLIAAVLIGFTYYSNDSAKKESARIEQEHRQDSINHAQAIDADYRTVQKVDSIPSKSNVASNAFGAPVTANTETATAASPADSSVVEVKEEIITLENDKVKVAFTTKGGQMLSAQLKNYTKFDGDSLYLFNKDASFYLQLRDKHGKALQTKNLAFTPIVSKGNDNQSLIMQYRHSETQYIDFIYTLSTDDYTVKYDIAVVGMEDMLDRESADMFELYWMQDLRRQEKSITNEQRYSRIYYKYVGDDVLELSDSKNEEKEASEATKWIAFKDQFFSSIIIADTEFKTIIVSSRMLASDDYLKTYSAKMYVPAKFDAKDNTLSAGFRFFLGPLEYSHLKSYDDDKSDIQQLDLDKLVPLGWTLFRWVNQYFVIPIFNMLRSTGLSMGLVILLLTFIVKIIISPLTYKSFMSSAKMRVLKPQVEALGAKYPKQEQAMEKQQATMALYRSAGANPMSGCIPMLLQMPILIALFGFFPTAIELRQQSFLWADDLSTYDAVWEWGSSIPLLGTHLSLFCILMTITNIIYTKFNMEMTNTGQQQMPGMKWMMYLMPVVFLFLLNDYPSGLTYYYFISLLITILLTLVFRYTINEEKLLAKLEANKAKPKKKKSGFMARLEDAQRMQQQQQAKGKKGKK